MLCSGSCLFRHFNLPVSCVNDSDPCCGFTEKGEPFKLRFAFYKKNNCGMRILRHVIVYCVQNPEAFADYVSRRSV